MAFLNKILEYLATAGVRLLCAGAILVVGWILINKLVRFIDKSKRVQKLDKTVRSFIKSALGIALKIILVITSASILGIPMTSSYICSPGRSFEHRGRNYPSGYQALQGR